MYFKNDTLPAMSEVTQEESALQRKSTGWNQKGFFQVEKICFSVYNCTITILALTLTIRFLKE